ncbi:hypothetical protein B0H13DRAFT_2262968 [Mycena leptocephala]|nr:hypothetical protein B0H13DRAFT_2262968 [Mycena leptocephala]
MATNYAQILGIQNKWAPIVFAVIYFLSCYGISSKQSADTDGYTASSHSSPPVRPSFFPPARARLINPFYDGEQLPQRRLQQEHAIAYMVLYNVGFFSILLSANRLLHDRQRLAKIDRAREKGRSFLPKMMGGFRKGRIVELLLLASVVIGAVGGAYALDANVSRTTVGNKLNEAGTYILLVVTVLIALLTFAVVRIERSRHTRNKHSSRNSHAPPPHPPPHHRPPPPPHPLLHRHVHQRASGQPTPASSASSSIRQSAQGNEHLWYPLAALAELLVVLLFLAPGLVPIRSLITRGGVLGMRGTRITKRMSKWDEWAWTTGAGYTAGDNAATGGLARADHVHGGGLGAV